MTGEQQAGALGSGGVPGHAAALAEGMKLPGLTAPLAMLALPPDWQLPLPTELVEWRSSVHLGFAKVCCTTLPARGLAAGKEEAAGQPLGAGWPRQGGQAEQSVPATH